MAFCGLFAFLIGYVMGMRFRIMIVLPIEMAACAAAMMLVLVGGIGIGEAFLGFVVFSVAMQVGYALALACPVPSWSRVGRGTIKA